MSTDTENAILAAAVTDSTVPQPVEAGRLYVVPQPGGGRKLIDLTGDEYREYPARKGGTVVTKDVASFAQYYGKHAVADSEIFADVDRGIITAVLDAHGGDEDEPRWQAHRVELHLTPTPQWKTWTAADRSYFPQVTFAEFLEDNLDDVAPEPVSAADLLEVATTFQTKTAVSFASRADLTSGSITLNYEENTDASAGAKGKLAVPRRFAVGLAPFDDVDRYRIEARLRHRVESGKLRLCFILDHPQDVLRAAVKDVIGQVEKAINGPEGEARDLPAVKVMIGASA